MKAKNIPSLAIWSGRMSWTGRFSALGTDLRRRWKRICTRSITRREVPRKAATKTTTMSTRTASREIWTRTSSKSAARSSSRRSNSPRRSPKKRTKTPAFSNTSRQCPPKKWTNPATPKTRNSSKTRWTSPWNQRTSNQQPSRKHPKRTTPARSAPTTSSRRTPWPIWTRTRASTAWSWCANCWTTRAVPGPTRPRPARSLRRWFPAAFAATCATSRKRTRRSAPCRRAKPAPCGECARTTTASSRSTAGGTFEKRWVGKFVLLY
uniref:(northern house mosquito) hypothetical protein n=1 Tax=Culex pipiens TaxID=7175 RepID=A0A8D8FDT0_CULPI